MSISSSLINQPYLPNLEQYPVPSLEEILWKEVEQAFKEANIPFVEEKSKKESKPLIISSSTLKNPALIEKLIKLGAESFSS